MKVDLHVHTYYSRDGSSSPQKIIETAISREIKCLAITDHHEIKGAIEALKFSFDKNILIIPGLEIRTKEGDILALGIKQIINDGFSALETIREIKKMGGFVILPHSFSLTNPFKFKKIDLNELLKLIDAVEVLNGHNFGLANRRALNFSSQHSLAFSAGSDAHHYSFVGICYMELPSLNSEKELFEAIRKKEVVIKGKEMSWDEKIKDAILKASCLLKNLLHARRE